MFPGGGVGYHCDDRVSKDTYDCRVRPWYLESKNALETDKEDSVQFSPPYIGHVGRVLMVTASKSVISVADKIFQGVVGIDMDMTFLMEPLAGIDAKEDSYSFVVDGSNGQIIAHPNLNDVPNFIEKAVQDKITEMLGKESAEFTLDLVRYKTFRNSILDSEDAESA